MFYICKKIKEFKKKEEKHKGTEVWGELNQVPTNMSATLRPIRQLHITHDVNNSDLDSQ